MADSPDDRFAGLFQASHRGWQPEDDLDDLVPGNRPVPTRTVIIVVAIAVVALIVGFVIYTALKTTGNTVGAEAAPVATQRAGAEPTQATEVTVHVAGDVKKPGVITLAAGSRVTDAIEAAGGFGADADTSAINLARILNDGEQILVPVKGEAPPAAHGSGPAGEAGGPGTKIPLNTADVTALETLPGVGPATSAAIIKYRDENGPFSSIDQLDDVPGIGPATLERLRPLVTL